MFLLLVFIYITQLVKVSAPPDQNYGNYGGVENYGWRFFLYLCEFRKKTKLIMFSVSLIVATWNIDRYKILVKGTFPEFLKKIWRHDVMWRHFLDFWFSQKTTCHFKVNDVTKNEYFVFDFIFCKSIWNKLSFAVSTKSLCWKLRMLETLP